MDAKSPSAVMMGLEIGTTTRSSTCQSEQPSILAESSIAEGTVKSLVYRALQKLRYALRDYREEG